jgi:hypothetical protein
VPKVKPSKEESIFPVFGGYIEVKVKVAYSFSNLKLNSSRNTQVVVEL